jgi:hypothetical protein
MQHFPGHDASDNAGHQENYLQRLKQLSQDEGQYYQRIFNEIADKKTLTNQIFQMLQLYPESEPVYKLAQELIRLIRDLIEARSDRNKVTIHRLLSRLEDINIAVNAWMNKICLPRSRFLYGQHQALRHAAQHSVCN